jgi:hypothetical protein
VRFLAAVFFLTLLDCIPFKKPFSEEVQAPAISMVRAKVGFCKPVVTESAIFYNNRYTDQNYHSVDFKRTEEAFFRDLKVVISDKKLAWRALSDDCCDAIRGFLAAARGSVDSLPSIVINDLARDSIDFVCVFYDVRFMHTQLVGTNSPDAGQIGTFGPGIDRKISYHCAIVDVKKNRTVFIKKISLEETGVHLDFLEKSIRMVFRDLLKDGP